MKDFDTERAARPTLDEEERTFKLGGETFVIRPQVRPDVLTPVAGIGTDGAPPGVVLAILDEFLTEILEGDGPERYMTLRARETDILTFQDLDDVSAWAMEVVTGRPTERSSPSTGSPGPTGTTSTEGSRLQAVTSTG